YYYIDKTLFIKDLIDNGGAVNVFTRPRRFGKTLALSMIKTYFEKEIDLQGNVIDNSHYFAGKNILEAGEKYTAHMGEYPVISLSLKSAKQPNFQMAYDSLIDKIMVEYKRHSYILNEQVLTAEDVEKYREILSGKAPNIVYAESLKFLSDCLKTYHKKGVIIIIDEYDVPLENSYFRGFYNEMIDFIRSLFESALKTNDSLEFAIITGCLRISKESIFTGLNNLEINSIITENYAEYFGFTTSEVEGMLKDYNQQEKIPEVKEWYDGYLFGETEVYNPWSVINYVKTAIYNRTAFPRPYWSNTSSNSIVRSLVEKADEDAKADIETLIQGGTIEKPIHEDITYEDIYKTQENLWNFLFFTGYLKNVKEHIEEENIVLTLEIPNREVRYIFKNTIREWFDSRIRVRDLSSLFEGILKGDAEQIQQELSPILLESVSYMDSYENFYHGFLLGILTNLNGYKVTSNREAGDGRYDISLESRDGLKDPVILEFKIGKRRPDLMKKAEEALQQIVEKRYDTPFIEEEYEQCIHVGIGFVRKMCRVKCETVRYEL
ncbi:MAG: AAA family ATPase, partial [Lachnospiraceae bacterium]|nr:AAA family ATPase [Lachnospiraceae bacterium]